MTPSEILQRFSGLRVLVVGDVMLDHYLWGDVSRISPEAPVPVVHVARQTDTAGGAANVALNLVSLGTQAEVIGLLGADAPAERLGGLLRSKGVMLDRCVRRSGVPTIVKTRVVARTQQVCRIDHEATRADYDPFVDAAFSASLAAAVSEADAVIVSDYAKGVVSQRLLDEVVQHCRRLGRILALDPKPSRRLNLRGAGILTPNRAEAHELAELSDVGGAPVQIDQLAARIHEKYAPDLLVITLGADGMALCRGGIVEHMMPTRAREVFDVSGAGDTVIATLTAALAAKASDVDAAHLANLAAGIVVSKFGTATVTPAEIEAFETRGERV